MVVVVYVLFALIIYYFFQLFTLSSMRLKRWRMAAVFFFLTFYTYCPLAVDGGGRSVDLWLYLLLRLTAEREVFLWPLNVIITLAFFKLSLVVHGEALILRDCVWVCVCFCILVVYMGLKTTRVCFICAIYENFASLCTFGSLGMNEVHYYQHTCKHVREYRWL